jgi:hypothetical protein
MQEARPRHPTSPIAIFAGLFILTFAISVASEFLLDRGMFRQSLFDLVNFTGPTTQSLIHHGGLTFCSYGSEIAPNIICFHAGRMPVGPFVVGAGILLFGDSFVRVSLFKIVLLLLPLELAIFLVCRRLPPSLPRRVGCVLLLLAPFGMTIFIANVVNLQVEEDYAYSLIACALALVLFGPFAFPRSRDSRAGASAHLVLLLLFVLSVDALYLSKSSLSLAVAVLTVAFVLQQRLLISRLALLALVAAAPLGWAVYTHHASGRYTLGTSLDGVNLHKGNGTIFMEHYPPAPLTSLDDYDGILNRGLHFPDEWSFNDYHLHAGIAYIRSHPRETLIAEWRKFSLLYLSITKYGSSDSHGVRLLVEKAGLLLFRIVFWSTIAFSLFALFSPAHRELRPAAITYLALVAACVLPYLIGFGYTRHASILIYPASLMGCRILCANGNPK